MSRSVLVAALLLAVVALSFADDITLRDVRVDIPPASAEEVKLVQEAENMSPWSKVAQEDLQVELDSPNDEEAIEEEDEELASQHSGSKADLLNISLDENEADPEAGSDLEIAEMKESLAKMKAELQPLHQQLCKKSAVHCHQRKMINAAIVKDILQSQCHRRARSCSAKRLEGRRVEKIKPSVRVITKNRCETRNGRRKCRQVRHCCQNRSCGICTQGVKELKAAQKQYESAHRMYSRLYIRYGTTLAAYYRRKFHMLAAVFLRTVHRIRQHIKAVKAKNDKLEDEINAIETSDREFTNRKAAEHQKRHLAMKALAAKHRAHVVQTAKTLADAKANIAGQKAKQAELQKAIDATKAKIAAIKADNDKNRDANAKMAAEAKNLSNKKDDLEKRLADLQKQFKNANTRIVDLQNLTDALKKQVELLQKAVDAARAAGTAAFNARTTIQTSYNSLLAKYTLAINTNAGLSAELKNSIDTLRQQLQEVTERCVADACGVCGGDESTCANTRDGHTCQSVGDPHFRSFDGVAFDFQFDGQFVLAEHGQDFEVQVLQRECHNGCRGPRINQAIGIRCGNDVLVSYEQWGLDTVLVNGAQTKMPLGKWTRIGDTCSFFAVNANHFIARFDRRGQVATTTVHKAFWPGGNHLNIYVTAPWQWSSGRSMWGLCGDFNNWAGDDSQWVNKNWRRQFAVTNTPKDLLVNPAKRNVVFLDDTTPSEREEIQKLDKLNDVVSMDELEVTDGTELHARMMAETAVAAKTKDQNPHPVELKATPEQITAARKHCGTVQKSPDSDTLKQCVFDVLNGMRGAAKTFEEANVKGHEKELRRCRCISGSDFGIYSKKDLPAPESVKEGFSVSAWIQPQSIVATERRLFQRGEQFSVTQSSKDIKLTIDTSSCTCSNAIDSGDWASLIVGVHRTNGATVFLNRKACCKIDRTFADGEFDKLFNHDIVLGSSNGDVADDCVAHFSYVANTITAEVAKNFVEVKPFQCKK